MRKDSYFLSSPRFDHSATPCHVIGNCCVQLKACSHSYLMKTPITIIICAFLHAPSLGPKSPGGTIQQSVHPSIQCGGWMAGRRKLGRFK